MCVNGTAVSVKPEIIGAMGFNFRSVDRDQLYVMPPSITEWLPEGHFAWAVLAAVDEMDLAEFIAAHRSDGRGGAAYDPAMMVGLLLYAYGVGERSSRRIERRCTEDVAFRVIAANSVPDHATLARFVTRHEAALAGLFADVLTMCARAGLIDTSVVAIDGTKIAADAAGAANRSLTDVARAVVREAIETDRSEDDELGKARGDELPAPLRNREWIKRAMGAISKDRERSIARRPNAPRNEPKINLTDPDSRIMRRPQGFVQGYNAQAAVSGDQIVVAAALLQDPVDTDALKPMAEQALIHLERVGKSAATLLADAGYWSPENGIAELGAELLIATHKRTASPIVVNVDELQTFIEGAIAGAITHRTAAARFGIPKTNFTRLVEAYQHDARASLSRLRMVAKLADPAARRLYGRRGITVEPVFGQIKSVRGMGRFRRRGLAACTAEWMMMVTTHNLLKWWRHGAGPAAA